MLLSLQRMQSSYSQYSDTSWVQKAHDKMQKISLNQLTPMSLAAIGRCSYPNQSFGCWRAFDFCLYHRRSCRNNWPEFQSKRHKLNAVNLKFHLINFLLSSQLVRQFQLPNSRMSKPDTVKDFSIFDCTEFGLTSRTAVLIISLRSSFTSFGVMSFLNCVN